MLKKQPFSSTRVRFQPDHSLPKSNSTRLNSNSIFCSYFIVFTQHNFWTKSYFYIVSALHSVTTTSCHFFITEFCTKRSVCNACRHFCTANLKKKDKLKLTELIWLIKKKKKTKSLLNVNFNCLNINYVLM